MIFAFHFFFQSVSFSTVGADRGYLTIIPVLPLGCRLAGPDPTEGFRTHVTLIVGFDYDKGRVFVKCLWRGESQPSSTPLDFWMCTSGSPISAPQWTSGCCASRASQHDGR